MNSSALMTPESHASVSGSLGLVVQPNLPAGLQNNVYYRKGDNVELDRKLGSYRKLRIWRGDAINQVFDDDEEFQVFGGLWRKERQARKLTVSEVLILIDFSDRIRA